MVLLVILDANQNNSNFRLFRIVKMVNLRSGGPSSPLVWRLGEKDAWYFIFSLSLRKKTPDRRLENSGKNMQRFFFRLKVLKKHFIVCDQNTLNLMWKLKSRIL